VPAAGPGNGVSPSVLDEWEAESQARGLSGALLAEVELPSGRRIRGRLPDAAQLLSRGLLPPELRPIALQIETNLGAAAAIGDTNRAEELRRYQKIAIVDFIEEIWSEARQNWEPAEGLTVERLDRLDRRDIELLGDVVLRVRTPAQVTALSRWNRGQIDQAQYDRIIEKEAPATVLGWLDFRLRRGRDAGSPDGQGMGQPPKRPSDDSRSTRGLRRRRGPGGARDASRGRRARQRSGPEGPAVGE
jgi:hypothetical protein